MIEELLTKCGLNVNEQKILISLMEHNRSAAGLIAKETGIKRSTVYSTLENLLALGLITRCKKGSVAAYQAISIDQIPLVIENHAKRKLEGTLQATELLRNELEEFKEKQQRGFVKYSVEYADVTETAYTQHFTESLRGDFCAIFNPALAINEFSRAGVKEFLEWEAKEKINIREIAVDGPETKWCLENTKNENHIMKFIPPTHDIRSNIIMREGTVVITHYSNDGMTAIKVNHEDYYISMMSIFEMLWKAFP